MHFTDFNQEYFTIPPHMCVSVCGLDVYFGRATNSECKDFNLTHSSCTYSVDFTVSYAIRKRLTPFLHCYERSGLKKVGWEERREDRCTHLFTLVCPALNLLVHYFSFFLLLDIILQKISIKQHTFNIFTTVQQMYREYLPFCCLSLFSFFFTFMLL